MASALLPLVVLGAARAAKHPWRHRLVGVAAHSLQHHRRLSWFVQPASFFLFHHTQRSPTAWGRRRRATRDHLRASGNQHLLHRWVACGGFQQAHLQRADSATRASSSEIWPRVFAPGSLIPRLVLGYVLAVAVHPHHPSRCKDLTRCWSEPLTA